MNDKALIPEVMNKPLTKEKVKPVLVFAKKEKKKYYFNKNTSNYYYNKTINNTNNRYVTPEINKEDGFIVSILKLFSSLFSLSFFLIRHFFSSLFNINNYKIKKKKKERYNKLREV